MAAIDLYQLATDSTEVSTIFYDSSNTLPDFSALNAAFNKFGKRLNNFFGFENHPQIPFYDTPQGVIFSGSCHRKVQMKRRVLEYPAKY